MIRGIIKIGLLLLVGILVYNYFFGNTEEKAQSKEIFHKVGELGKAGIGILKSEKDKFDNGKYDDALDKIGGLFQSMKKRAEDIKDSGAVDKLIELERTRKKLEEKVNDEDSINKMTDKEKEDLKKEWSKMMDETEKLMKELDEKN
ncbi:MAG: hypothetical protein H6562_08625 [Lewinellaceae bacterium]|nr:hypothetical protein [Lewinella sp.]MCB9278962.1 hypothetical protein [Lewinellaceae bacterium]